MKKLFISVLASVLLCLALSITALAGDTPISNLTDGDTPISKVKPPPPPPPPGDLFYEFAGYISSELMKFLN